MQGIARHSDKAVDATPDSMEFKDDLRAWIQPSSGQRLGSCGRISCHPVVWLARIPKTRSKVVLYCRMDEVVNFVEGVTRSRMCLWRWIQLTI